MCTEKIFPFLERDVLRLCKVHIAVSLVRVRTAHANHLCLTSQRPFQVWRKVTGHCDVNALPDSPQDAAYGFFHLQNVCDIRIAKPLEVGVYSTAARTM